MKSLIGNIEVIWLLKKLSPDFKTIADFRKDNLQPLQNVCRSFTLLCKQLDLFGGELVAIDSSKFKAVNNRQRNFSHDKLSKAIERIDATITSYLEALNTTHSEQPTRPQLSVSQLHERIAHFRQRKQEYVGFQQLLAASGQTQLSLTDPHSRSMVVTQGTDVCYNVEIAVDAKHKLIVTHEVTNDVTDQDQLAPLAIAAKEVLEVEQLAAVADKGFYDGEQIKACEKAGIVAYVPNPIPHVTSTRACSQKRIFAMMRSETATSARKLKN